MNDFEIHLRQVYQPIKDGSPFSVNDIDCSNKMAVYLAIRSAIKRLEDHTTISNKESFKRGIAKAVIDDVSKIENVKIHFDFIGDTMKTNVFDGLATAFLYGAALGLPHSPFIWHALDFEIISDWKAFEKYLILDDKETPAHLYSRAQIIMNAFDLTKCVTFVCHPDGSKKMFFVDYNENDYNTIKANIICASENPEIKDNDQVILFEAIRGNKLKSSCRTCKHVKQSGTGFYCTRRGKESPISERDQFVGFGCYLVSPEFVPLELIHIGDTCGVYRLDEDTKLLVTSDEYTGKPKDQVIDSRSLGNLIIDQNFVTDRAIYDLMNAFDAKIS